VGQNYLAIIAFYIVRRVVPRNGSVKRRRLGGMHTAGVLASALRETVQYQQKTY